MVILNSYFCLGSIDRLSYSMYAPIHVEISIISNTMPTEFPIIKDNEKNFLTKSIANQQRAKSTKNYR